MRKELIIAIIVGVLLGLAVAFGVWRANSAFVSDKENKEEIASEIKDSTKTAAEAQSKLVLAQPENYAVITEEPVTVSGITTRNSWIVISAHNKDYIMQTDVSGSFNKEVSLEGGANQIIVSSFDENETENRELLTLVYSTEFKVDTSSEESDADKNATPSDEIREKVREKVETVRKNPKAYLGTITDKTQETLQIKNMEGEIQLISVKADATSIVKTGKGTSPIKFNDLAIGDFIIAMGFVDASPTVSGKTPNGVLSSERIIVSAALDKPTRNTVFGNVVSLDKSLLSVNTAAGKELKLTFPKKWDGPELKEFAEGDKVITVYEPDENTLNIRTIEIANQKTLSTSPAPED